MSVMSFRKSVHQTAFLASKNNVEVETDALSFILPFNARDKVLITIPAWVVE